VESAAAVAANPSQDTHNKAQSSMKKPRTKPVHPPTSEMVGNAIKSLKERGGSSLQEVYRGELQG
jgi:hypothetical protein